MQLSLKAELYNGEQQFALRLQLQYKTPLCMCNKMQRKC